MTAPSDTDRVRLAKLLGMLGSDHAGERASAGAAAHRLIKSLGSTWQQILAPPPPPPPPDLWKTVLIQALSQAASLTPIEYEFLMGLTKQVWLIPQQEAWLNQIANRVMRKAA